MMNTSNSLHLVGKGSSNGNNIISNGIDLRAPGQISSRRLSELHPYLAEVSPRGARRAAEEAARLRLRAEDPSEASRLPPVTEVPKEEDEEPFFQIPPSAKKKAKSGEEDITYETIYNDRQQPVMVWWRFFVDPMLQTSWMHIDTERYWLESKHKTGKVKVKGGVVHYVCVGWYVDFDTSELEPQWQHKCELYTPNQLKELETSYVQAGVVEKGDFNCVTFQVTDILSANNPLSTHDGNHLNKEYNYHKLHSVKESGGVYESMIPIRNNPSGLYALRWHLDPVGSLTAGLVASFSLMLVSIITLKSLRSFQKPLRGLQQPLMFV